MKECRAEFPPLPERISGLEDLAFNLWWSWHPEARQLFKMLNRAAWKVSVHNPVMMLREMDTRDLDRAAEDPRFLRHYDAVMARFKSTMMRNGGWFYDNISETTKHPIAFFSAEYGLQHSLPFYAGGLGFLAGDFLKESSDLSIPMVGIGFMYPGGYVRQRISSNGWQMGEEEPLDRLNAPICRLTDDKGKRFIVKVPVITPHIYIEIWKVQVGRVPLYLINTDIDENDPWNREITSRLYMGNPEQRLRQEIVLGIGGIEVLNALGISHSLVHLNEGHPAFALLEKIRLRVEKGVTFDQAYEEVRAATVFTTHTPVPAGHDIFPYPLIEKYFSSYWPSLGLDREGFFRLGLESKAGAAGFNMTAFALRSSAYRNGVSRQHGEVSRRMWRSLWPDLTDDKVPVEHITNGIHIPTWIEPKTQLLFNKYLGPDWLSSQDDPDIWQLVEDIQDEELWQRHIWIKTKLILKIMEGARLKWLEEGTIPGNVLASGVFLDPTVLTIGFARRFATYKRATLIMRDMERLKKMLNDRWRPIQIIYAGKAHPDDDRGKELLREVFAAAKDPACGGRVAFVEDYGEQMAQYLLHGVDVWLNNPIPPFEACGTSGMKAALNGVPHLSIKDGWWIEGFNGKNGWSFDGRTEGQDDIEDAGSLYRILENEIIPLYYRVGDDGIPHDWVKVMKEAIKSIAPYFNSRRMVKEYAARFYKKALLDKGSVV